MLPAPASLLYLLYACIIGMAVLAAFSLRRRKLTPYQYISWGLLALLVPLLGPFLVVAYLPRLERAKSAAPRKSPKGRLPI